MPVGITATLGASGTAIVTSQNHRRRTKQDRDRTKNSPNANIAQAANDDRLDIGNFFTRFIVHYHAMNQNRLGGNFDLLLPATLESELQLAGNLIKDGRQNINATRVRYPFQPGGHIDAIALNIITVDNNIADIGTNSMD